MHVNAQQWCAGLSSIVTALVIGLALWQMTGVFRWLPMNALAAIVIAGVWGLLDLKQGPKYWQVCGSSTRAIYCFCGTSARFEAWCFTAVRLVGSPIMVLTAVVISRYEGSWTCRRGLCTSMCAPQDTILPWYTAMLTKLSGRKCAV